MYPWKIKPKEIKIKYYTTDDGSQHQQLSLGATEVEDIASEGVKW